MKQHITLKQWDEITKEQKNILWDKGFKKDWQMSIGQMIEFLKEETEDNFIDKYFINQIHIGFNGHGLQGCDSNISIGWDGDKEFCDALWDNCKLRLKKICLKK